MSTNEQESRFQVNYSLEDTFQALQSAIEKLEGFETVSLDAEQHSIHLKAQSALFSSVEELTITVSNCDNQSAAVTILTVPNPTGALLNNVRPPEKRRNHLREIMGALNNELLNYQPMDPSQKKETLYTFFCPYCGQKYQGGKEYVGQNIECTNCQRRIVLLV